MKVLQNRCWRETAHGNVTPMAVISEVDLYHHPNFIDCKQKGSISYKMCQPYKLLLDNTGFYKEFRMLLSLLGSYRIMLHPALYLIRRNGK
ncbi:hypothetical protein T4D_2406 [Trichinella pseudospiralis]|uniref:Uncharacterized protein n=1 Tax=Trichinella pseudospiralis TaxID=6337 RepID=A0A0V1FFK0_TRIPS|nr:hypothetical protein T4D_2406 [Trichinella pseudospiralis]